MKRIVIFCLMLFVLAANTNIFAAPLFKRIVNHNEKLVGYLLTADDFGDYPYPGIPPGWEISALEENYPDYFDLGQVHVKQGADGRIKIYVRLEHAVPVYNKNFTVHEFVKRVQRIKELEEINLKISEALEDIIAKERRTDQVP